MNKTYTPQEILKSIIAELHMSVRSFALGMDEPYSKIFDIYSGRTRVITPGVARSIEGAYNVNMEYIRTGRGEIFKSPTIETESVAPQNCVDVIKALCREISQLKQENKELKELLLQRISV